jgi:hypothetical protein
MPFLLTYTPAVQGALIDLQVKALQPSIGALVWGTAFRMIYTDLITAMTSGYTSAVSSLVISFPPASPAPATVVPVPIVLAPLSALAPVDGLAVDGQVKGVLGTSIPSWTFFFTQLYSTFGQQFTLALSTALTSLVITAQPLPTPGVGLLAPAIVTALPPWTPADFAPLTAQLSALAPASAAIVDAPIRAASLGGPAAGGAIWDIIIAQITLDLNTVLASLATLIPTLGATKLMLGPTSAPPALAAPVPPAPPVPLPPIPALVV